MLRRRLGRTMRWCGIAVVLVWSIFPVYWALNTSLMTNSQAQATNVQLLPLHPIWVAYQAIFDAGPDASYAGGGVGTSLLNASIESGGATLLTVVVAALGAYAFARLRFRLRTTLFYAVLGTLTLPIYATLIPLYRLMVDARLDNTYLGIILVYASGFVPLATWILYNTFLAVPATLEEAAFIDGARPIQAFFRVVLPIAAPGIAATAIIVFLFGWGQFIFPLVLSSSTSTQPLTVWLASLASRHVSPFNVIDAAAVVGIAVPSVIVVFFHRWIVDGIVAGSLK